ncbi:ATP-dependent helicase [Bacillus sp. SCS-151]|uniref:ATP-dependent helicase n=1 Tax=Nanhaiella sioensis TaxID=3115293 RepID=UPI00397B3837
MVLKFNDQQLQAINFNKGACAVIAGAGSGKSTVLLNRIKNLIEVHNVNQNDILTISFTRNTVNELKGKLKKMGYIDVNVGTFHSTCGKILTDVGLDVADTKKLIKEWEVENCFKKINPKADVEEIKGFIGYQKNYLKSYQDTFIQKDSKYDENELRTFFKAYEQFKQDEDRYDFEDYLIECYKLLKDNPKKHTYEYVLVDEHQDSNLVQNLLLKQLCKSGNIFCVFDYRQAIYSFRGGNTEYCMNFDKEWKNATIINLDTNYRSKANIVNKANKFIKKYYGDYEHYSDSVPNESNKGNINIKTYYERESEGNEVVNHIERLIKNGDKLSDICVLYRQNSHSSYVENELKRKGIDYEISDKSSFFKRKEILGIMSYLRLIHNPHDDSAMENIFKLRNYPFRFFSGKLIDNIRKYSGVHNMSLFESVINMAYPEHWQQSNANDFERNITKLRLQKDKDISLVRLIDNVVRSFELEKFVKEKYTNEAEIDDRLNSIEVLKTFVKGNNLESFISYAYTASTNSKRKFRKDSVKLMSVHVSKGLEFKNVFVIGIEDEKFPHERSDLLEEARLFYVAVTRPIVNLHISQIGEDNQFVKEYLI